MTGLIAAAVVSVFRAAVLNIPLYQLTKNIGDLISLKYILFFAVIFLAIRKFKQSPILYIAISAAAGIAMKF